MRNIISLIFVLFIVPSIVFAENKSTTEDKSMTENKSVPSELDFCFKIKGISEITQPVITLLNGINDNLNLNVKETRKLILKLNSSDVLTKEQNEEFLNAIRRVSETSATIDDILKNRKDLFDDLQTRSNQVVAEGVKGLILPKIKRELRIVYLFLILVIVTIGIFVSVYLYQIKLIVKDVKKIPLSLAEISKDIKETAQTLSNASVNK
jgi:uncharacterized protein (UPF0335 family)